MNFKCYKVNGVNLIKRLGRGGGVREGGGCLRAPRSTSGQLLPAAAAYPHSQSLRRRHGQDWEAKWKTWAFNTYSYWTIYMSVPS